MHRLTSIVEEKDIIAAKEMFKNPEIAAETNGNLVWQTPPKSLHRLDKMCFDKFQL